VSLNNTQVERFSLPVILRSRQMVLSEAKELMRSFTSFRMTLCVRFFAVAQNDKNDTI